MCMCKWLDSQCGFREIEIKWEEFISKMEEYTRTSYHNILDVNKFMKYHQRILHITV
jgi:hypothetical protein